ncbi:MAG TPA: DUF3280 domain-containing protein [Xanthobacteraceae bacterium]|nr:DUF3280 domain-containing protein [Xanthobacteraceae bacterium]
MRILLATLLLVLATATGRTADVPRVAFLGFSLINTSLEATTPAERQRLVMLDDLLRSKIEQTGCCRLVPVPPEVQKDIATAAAITDCNGCERDYARRAGADWAAWGTVQKVSNLILNINLYMEDARSGKMEFVKSVDIRGNTDESWRHGLDYMLRNYLHAPR